MKLARAIRMRPDQLVDRLRQEQRKVLERLRVVGPNGVVPGAPTLADFRRAAPSRFFAGASDARTPALICERLPRMSEQVLKAAEQSLAGRFDLLGYRDLSFGEPVDWFLDPVSGTRSPRRHWSRIDPLDRSTAGDHKVVWELNRHQWLLRWAQAYAFTRDEEYAERSVEALERWLRANPPGVGINWVSSLELALRIVSWCWTLVLLRDARALRPDLFARVVASLHAHAEHIAAFLSSTYSPNTHLLGEALGLFYVGVLFPELEHGSSWRATGEHILIEQASRQILPDGVCFEQSTCYQRYTAEMYMHFLILAGRNGLTVPAEVSARVQSSVDFLLAVSRADGSAPQIGDGDGGWLLPLVPRESEDMRGVFGVAAALFGEPQYHEAAGGPTVEAAWLLGPDALRRERAVARDVARHTKVQSHLFAEGGYAVLRGNPGSLEHKLILDVGPLGCPASGAHGHADLLSLTCDIFGAPCIVDPGMPTYGGDPAWRDAFRSTALHNSVVVDGLSQAVPAGMFSWRERPDARVRAWTSNDEYDCIDAEHGAYEDRCDGVCHRRRVIFVKPRYWVVVDELTERLTDGAAGAEHRIDLGFQFAPGHSLTIERPWVRAVTPGGRALLMRATAQSEIEANICEGELGQGPTRGWFSPAYGRVVAAPMVGYRVATKLPVRITTFLLPVDHADATVPAVFPPEPDASLLRRLSTLSLQPIAASTSD